MIPQKTNFLDEHPMLIQEYAIYTPAIAEFFKIICEWIDNRVPGAYIYGFSRLGKSRAIRFWIKSLISERYGNRIAFFDMKHKNHDRPSETTFLIELLMAFDHQLKKTGKTTDKYERVVNFMCCQARNQNTNYVVLMIDEAQFMHDQEYKWLCNIQNEMDGMGFRFTVISVGSHELTYQHEIFAMAESAYILSRFMVRSYAFNGIRNSKEMEYVLKGYDEDSEWPVGSGKSFTAYFFPRAFKAGFRISETADDLWEIFFELAPASLKNKLNIPMEHIAKSVEYIFRELSGPEVLHVPIEKAWLTKAVKQTGYEHHMHAVGLIVGRKN